MYDIELCCTSSSNSVDELLAKLGRSVLVLPTEAVAQGGEVCDAICEAMQSHALVGAPVNTVRPFLIKFRADYNEVDVSRYHFALPSYAATSRFVWLALCIHTLA